MEPNYGLCAAIRSCTKCPAMVQLREQSRSFSVPAEVGADYSTGGIAIICEAPGADEAKLSRPLVGKAGRLLDVLLEEAQIDRRSLVLMNRVRCRPPNNRLASVPEAIPNCDEWLQKELTEYNPRCVVVMGGTALSLIFGANAKVGATRGVSRTTGSDFPYGSRTWVATYHPASLFQHRSPENYPLVVQDLELARDIWQLGLRQST